MRAKRELASAAIGALGLTHALGTVRSTFIRDFRVLAYHRVLETWEEASFDYDLELISARREEFEWQMNLLANRFNVVSCKQVSDAINHGLDLPSRAMMITFDDGFGDNYEVAFPVLAKIGLPATFFLSTGYISTQRLFWFDWVVHAILRTREKRIRLHTVDMDLKLEDTPAPRRRLAADLLRVLKRLTETQRLATLEELRHVSGVGEGDVGQKVNSPMTWDEVREMSQAGMDFGSHTVSHPVLSMITDREQLCLELRDSKEAIERETSRPVIALSYPVGGGNAVNDLVLAATADAGYEFAFSYEPGTNYKLKDDRWSLKRIHVERYTGRSAFRAAIEMPELFAR